ncbi:hypothetical protein K469DRAFT_292571 [Zopfia rhizophila CBS 207.26]|uniref:Zinc finger PHD-type domain-containing protein n=1 Tax=Zopfia rhizophila CBS 207.26 TaxID=1314779 RepID=A0A6A6DLJ7_9PEZI|nr:hypothetical protein K469DRAFT_292571 [Zopfia rhizophila CBS 207.26]
MATNNLLFKWEEGLKHHCGFCDRPLSHPGAKSSCLGEHSEPCRRYHQGMLFMRARSHQCAACIGADEKHHERHYEIAEALRGIYECCGLHIYAKNLVKAASRPKVITSAEINYVGSVLHLRGDIPGDEGAPSNPEEIEEIELNLRYNAQVYTTSQPRAVVKGIARLENSEVDFEVEMDRILDVLKVTELLRSNSKNRGLKGKDLKTFESLVRRFKGIVVEDLVLMKKEEMETRMRRAGYLRYVNRYSFDIIEDRHKVIDWRTGERIVHTPDEDHVEYFNKGNTPPSQETGHLDPYVSHDERKDSLDPLMPDLRHLHQTYLTSGPLSFSHYPGDVKTAPPRLPASPSPGNPPTLRIVNYKKPDKLPGNRAAKEDMSANGWTVVGPRTKTEAPAKKGTANPGPKNNPPGKGEGMKRRAKDQFPVQSADELSWPVVAEKIEKPVVGHELDPQKKAKKEKTFNARVEFVETRNEAFIQQPLVSQNKIQEMTAPAVKTIVPTKAPEGVVASQLDISRKKAKKAKRNAEWKARKEAKGASEASSEAGSKGTNELTEDEAGQTFLDEAVRDGEIWIETIDVITSRLAFQHHVDSVTPSERGQLRQEIVADLESINADGPMTSPNPETKRTYAPLTVARHYDWQKFAEYMAVDALSHPNQECPYDATGLPDCPLHIIGPPHDPLDDMVYVCLPETDSMSISSGPYNRKQGNTIAKLFQGHDLTHNRIMVIDEDLFDWLCFGQYNKDGIMPTRLQKEYDTYNEGEATKQWHEFNMLVDRNKHMPRKLERNELAHLHRELDRKAKGKRICYCGGRENPAVDGKEGNIVECAFRHCRIGRFHRDCIKEFHPELLSKWYCIKCSDSLHEVARNLPNRLDKPKGDVVYEMMKKLAEELDEDVRLRADTILRRGPRRPAKEAG